jgi:hypothetical protein
VRGNPPGVSARGNPPGVSARGSPLGVSTRRNHPASSTVDVTGELLPVPDGPAFLPAAAYSSATVLPRGRRSAASQDLA